MSSLYKKGRFYHWEGRYKGRRFQRSTRMTKRSLARKIVEKWDMALMMDDTRFLNLKNQSSINVKSYFRDYLMFVEKRKSENTLEITKGVLKKFAGFLKTNGVERIDEITVKLMDDYLDWLDNAPKTKKNYLNIISIMMKYAVKYGLIHNNPIDQVTKPRVPRNKGNGLHRVLEPLDLEIIFDSAGIWYNYYKFLLHTGLRAGDVVMLTYGNIDFGKKAIVSLIRKSRRIHELPLADHLLDLLDRNQSPDTPLFPRLYTDNDKRLNWRLKGPRTHMQTMLKLNGRSHATLHSFRHTFNHELAKLGLSIVDRQVLLTHASSETTKIYTHPNFELASKYVNMIPMFNKDGRENCRD